jgi:hypothetical protein
MGHWTARILSSAHSARNEPANKKRCVTVRTKKTIELTPLEHTVPSDVSPNNRDKCASFYPILAVQELVLHRHPGRQAANLPLLAEGGQSALAVLRRGDIPVRSFAAPPA